MVFLDSSNSLTLMVGSGFGHWGMVVIVLARMRLMRAIMKPFLSLGMMESISFLSTDEASVRAGAT